MIPFSSYLQKQSMYLEVFFFFFSLFVRFIYLFGRVLSPESGEGAEGHNLLNQLHPECEAQSGAQSPDPLNRNQECDS